MLKKFLFSTLLLASSSLSLQAQSFCGTPSPHELSPEQQAAAERIEAQTREYVLNHPDNKDGRPGPTIPGDPALTYITLPVVVHVVHNLNNPNENISDAQIAAQIASMNNDFARTNPDAANTPSAFAGVAADMGIRFRLATRDPNGGCTNGIVRVETSQQEFSTRGAELMKYGGHGSNAWDPLHYVNIWVCDLAADGGIFGSSIVTGYSSFPTIAGQSTDGVVIDYEFFGPTSSPTHGLGRTATHELGHYLNLYHIWDGGPAPGYCTGDDQVSDTPPQAEANFGCPTFPHVTCSNGPNGDMFMNYMDYTNQQCKNLFTAGQSTRALSLFQSGGARASLLASRAFLAPLAPTFSNASPPISFCDGGVFNLSVHPVCNAVSYTFTIDPVDWRTGFINNNSISEWTTTNLVNPSASFVMDRYPAYTKKVCVKANFANGTSTGAACQTFRVVNGAPAQPSVSTFREGATCYYGALVPIDPNVDEYGVTVNGGGTQWKAVPAGATGSLQFLLHMTGAQNVSIQVQARNTCGTSSITKSFYLPHPPDGCDPNPMEGRPAGPGSVTAVKEAQPDATALLASPNPATSDLLITSTGTQGVKQGVIRTLTGQVVKRFTLTSSSATLRIADLREGLYLIEVSDASGTQRTRVVVTHP